MLIHDKIYGKTKIEEKVLVDLLKSKPVLRLKGISNYGIPDKYYSFKGFSRFEHSLGVMILLKKLGASIEEQIAGLIHDVSHFTFSHIADWVFAKGKKGVEDFHGTLHEKFINNLEISTILKEYDFQIERILDEKNFSLLEKLRLTFADKITVFEL